MRNDYFVHGSRRRPIKNMEELIDDDLAIGPALYMLVIYNILYDDESLMKLKLMAHNGQTIDIRLFNRYSSYSM